MHAAHTRQSSHQRESAPAPEPPARRAGRRSGLAPASNNGAGGHAGASPAARERAEFAATLAHELRTPITVINGNARILQDEWGALSPEQKLQALRDIRDESERVKILVEDLTTLAVSPDAADVGDATEAVRMSDVLEMCVERQRRRHPDRAIELDTAASRRLALGVPRYIEQIVDNLLSNAIKYSPASSIVRVFVVDSQDEVEVHVLDRGIGIDSRFVGRLFKPFVRAPKAAAIASGTGIGLVVAKRLAEAQGGRVWGRQREGGGSDFGFSLPAAERRDDAVAPRPRRTYTTVLNDGAVFRSVRA